MAKLKIKQIEDLSLVGRLLTVGKGPTAGSLNQVEFQAAQEGKYVSGFSLEGTKVTPTFKDLPSADIFSTGLTTTTAATTGQRTITLDNAYVKDLFSVAPASGTGYISGLTYEDGVFTPTYTAMPVINDGILTITVTDGNGATFTANQAGNSSLTLAKVAESGAAEDVIYGDSTVADTLTEVLEAIENLEGIDPVVTTVVAGTGITVTPSTTGTEGNDVTYTVSQNIKLALADNILQVLPNSGEDTTPIATVDLSQFAIDGMLKDATYDSSTKDLTLTFNTDADEKVIVVPLDDLVDTYTADETYIKVADNKFSHAVKTGLPTEAQGISAAVTVNSTNKTGTFNVPNLTVDAAGHVSVLGQQQVSITLPEAAATTTKKVYTPAEKTQTGNGVFTVAAGACHFRMYMNGQLLDSDAYTHSGTTVTYNANAYVPLESTDRMDLIYFIEETITVFNNTTQAE